MFRIEAPHFVAGLITTHRRVTEAAPITKYMVGWDITKVLKYCQTKEWRLQYVREA